MEGHLRMEKSGSSVKGFEELSRKQLTTQILFAMLILQPLTAQVAPQSLLPHLTKGHRVYKYLFANRINTLTESYWILFLFLSRTVAWNIICGKMLWDIFQFSEVMFHLEWRK